jgi:GT2 family glycosyltransferase
VLGDERLRPLPISVWIEGGEPEHANRTRAALDDSTEPTGAVLFGSLRAALARIRTDHVMLVRAGDEPAPLALERFGQAAALAPDASVITCDDDLLTGAGTRSTPRFRPGPSPDRWLACDDSGPLLMVRRDQALSAMAELDGGPAWRHELAMRLSGPDGRSHAHIPVLLCHRGPDVPDPPALEPDVVTRVLRQHEPTATLHGSGPVRTVWRPLASEPKVEIVICLRDRPELLARCVVSLLSRSAYDRLSVALVDNGSDSADTLRLLGGLARQRRVRVLRDPTPFNFAALNNRAVATSSADVIVFLNNDTEIIADDWVTVLLQEALRPEIGAVAPMLLYPNGNVQHAGAVLGLHGYAGHPFAGLSPDALTPFGYAAQGTRNWLAVTAACMMIERSKFMAVGGFDEKFVVAGNDVDLCLRLTAAGHRSVCVPHSTVLHDESRSRGAHVDPGDFVVSERSYGTFRTIGDPFYNPNLTLRLTDCSVRTPSD